MTKVKIRLFSLAYKKDECVPRIQVTQNYARHPVAGRDIMNATASVSLAERSTTGLDLVRVLGQRIGVADALEWRPGCPRLLQITDFF